jgi:hypothetical protein
VLAEYGYAAEEIHQLTQDGAVGAKEDATNRGFAM